jgi:cytochrome c oxidase cbb3-type subunit III
MLFMRNKIKYILCLFSGILLMAVQPALAAGPQEPSPLNNPLAVMLIVLMLLMLIIIGILANILLGTADLKLKKKNKSDTSLTAAASVILFLLLLASPSLFAQNTTTTPAAGTATNNYGGLSATTFYIMITVIFLELLVIIGLLLNIKILLKVEKQALVPAAEAEVELKKKNQLSWWDRFNKLRPVSQEAELDLGHEYDGIRELNNRLPPWWLYGFYLTIIFAGIYMWRFHVSHNGPSSKEEYDRSVATAELRIQDYLKKKGDAVDENTVKLLTDAADISEGKIIFQKSCAACHKETGAGDVGPNLTDDYWLHGNNIKDIFKTIRYGINAMPQWQNAYSNKQIAQVASYIKTLQGTNPPNPKAAQGTLQKEETAPAKPTTDSAVKENKVAMTQ